MDINDENGNIFINDVLDNSDYIFPTDYNIDKIFPNTIKNIVENSLFTSVVLENLLKDIFREIFTIMLNDVLIYYAHYVRALLQQRNVKFKYIPIEKMIERSGLNDYEALDKYLELFDIHNLYLNHDSIVVNKQIIFNKLNFTDIKQHLVNGNLIVYNNFSRKNDCDNKKFIKDNEQYLKYLFTDNEIIFNKNYINTIEILNSYIMIENFYFHISNLYLEGLMGCARFHNIHLLILKKFSIQEFKKRLYFIKLCSDKLNKFYYLNEKFEYNFKVTDNNIKPKVLGIINCWYNIMFIFNDDGNKNNLSNIKTKYTEITEPSINIFAIDLDAITNIHIKTIDLSESEMRNLNLLDDTSGELLDHIPNDKLDYNFGSKKIILEGYEISFIPMNNISLPILFFNLFLTKLVYFRKNMNFKRRMYVMYYLFLIHKLNLLDKILNDMI
jgi:hypothetical protein